jgi:chromate reductase
MLPDFLKQPVLRDTTTRSPRDIVNRVTPVLGAALLVGGILGRALPAAVIGLAHLALGLALLLRRPAAKSPESVPLSSSSAPTAAALPPNAAPRPRILLLNASLAGPNGNSARLLALLAPRLAPHADLHHAALAGPDALTFAVLEPALRSADAFVFATGTHWDSWSSPLQTFLEDATPAEATALWLGKPAAVLVTEHSTGGKGVLSRLQGVLLTLGCALPPLTGLVLSQAAQLARQNTPAGGAADDLWQPADLDIIAHNLLAATLAPRPAYRAWMVDRTDYAKPWLVLDCRDKR